MIIILIAALVLAPAVFGAAPEIANQPQNRTNAVGTDAVFEVIATGDSPLAYQWFFNETSLADATNTSLVLTNVQKTQIGNYQVVVAGESGSVTSAIAYLEVLVPPGIAQQPVSLTVTQGASVSFSVVASGDEPLSYQWYYQDEPLPEETVSALTLTDVQTNQAGAYRLVVSNPVGAITSVVAQLTVFVPWTMTCPDDVVVQTDAGQCVATEVKLGSPTFSDNSGSVSVTNDAPEQYGLGQTLVTWTAWDGSGNTNTCIQRVTVRDTSLPVVTLNGTNLLVLECGSAFNDPGASATDDCATNLPVTVSGSVDANVVGSYTLTYSATDGSGNVGVATRTVEVRDTTPPTMTCPDDVVVETDPGLCVATGVKLGSPSFSDNSGSVSLTNDAPEQYGLGQTLVTWIAWDASGNTNLCTQRVTVRDTSLPVVTLTGTNTLVLECGSTFSDPGASATDNCATNLPVTVSGSVNANVVGSYTLSYSATDGSGNVGVATRTVEVRDTTPPTMTCPEDVVVETDAGQCVATGVKLGSPTFSDNSGSVSFTNDAPEQYGLGQTLVTWTAWDASGNTNTCIQRVTVRDTSLPVVTLNGTNLMVLECGSDFSDPGASAADNCATNLPVTVSGSVNANVVGSYTLTYSATDASGNVGVATRTVGVRDTTPPTMTCPEDVVVETDAGQCVATGVKLGSPSFSDNSGSVSFTNDAPEQYGLGQTLVTWTAWDASGNTNICTQRVTVRDTSLPVVTLSGANPLVVECGSTFSDPGASANDNCATNLPVAVSGTVNANVVGSYTLTYSATDGSGNVGMATRTVEVRDTTPPTMTCPEDVFVETDAGQCVASGVKLGSPTFSDNSGSVSVTNDAPEKYGLGQTLVTWTAWDASGNTNTCTQRVTVRDTSLPVVTLNGTNTLVLECGSTFSDPGASATDNCATNLAVTVSGSVNANVVGSYTLSYSATDASGNVGLVTRTVEVRDTTPPTMTCPEDVVVETDAGQCVASGVKLGSPTFSDNSGSVSVTNDAPEKYGLGQTVVTWIAWDASGNTNSCNQRVTVRDTSLPVVTLNGTNLMVLECGSSFSDPGASATDNCATNLPVTVSGSVDANVVGSYTLTYSATDASGNVGVATRTVEVRDTTPPTMTCPEDVVVETDAGQCVATGVKLGSPTFSDNSGSVNVTNDAPEQYGLGQTLVTWIAWDASGNTNTCTQRVTVRDTSLPVVTLNGTNLLVLECGSTFNDPGASATDNCATNLAVTVSGNVNANVVGSYTLTYSATDGSGNVGVSTRTVEVRDTTPPSMTCPDDVVVETDAGQCVATGVKLGNPSFSDNSGSVSVTNDAPEQYGLGQTLVTWTAWDASGNTNTCIQRVTVRDTSLPVVTLNGTNTLVLECGSTFSDPGASATDNCATNLPVTVSGSVNADVVGSYTLSYSATDGSGNVGVSTRTVEVRDTTPPSIVCTTNFTEVAGADCRALVPDILGSLIVTDNSETNLTLTQEPLAGAFVGLGTNTITATATDSRGNSSQSTIYYVVIEPPPFITSQPESRTNIQGTTATLSVAVTACSAVSYQWYFEEILMAGQTNAALELRNIQPSQAGAYKVVASTVGGSVTSAVSRVTVLAPPSIVQEPVSLTVTQGNKAVFTVAVAGDEPFNFQWYWNENLLTGATNASLVLSNVQPNQAGTYHVVVDNAFGSATSVVAVLVVRQPPTITLQPKNRNLVEGSDYTFIVAATGDAPLLYQWQFNGATFPNETNATLALQNIQSSNAGGYQVIVSNPAGAVTSFVAVLTVRRASDPAFATPNNGWSYIYSGDEVLSSDGHALDGTWDHKNQSDSWFYDGRGTGSGLPGGVSSTNGILSIEDALTSGTTDIDNRRYYFTHNLNQESAVTNASTLLNDGVTLSFRARLTPPQPLDPLTELADAPFGYANSGAGHGMFGIRQAGGGGMIISFSLNEAVEDINTTSNWNFGQAGLHMNNLNGDARSAMVDPNLGGVVNLLPLDPTVFHEFWITIQDNGSEPGTHQVTIYVDGNLAPNVFNVTAGTAADVSLLDASSTNYVALGLGNTPQRGAVDVDYFAYKPGVIAPVTWNEPVGIVQQPTNQLVAEGQVAMFTVGVTGTPPFAYQWFKNGQPVLDATNTIYTTAPATPSDAGSEIVVVVSNICNIVTSAPAMLNILLPPEIVSQPQDQVVPDGQPAGFSVNVTSDAAVTYQWRYNSEILPGQTSSNLWFSAVSPANAGLYDVLVSNFGGTTTSTVARLTVQAFDFGDAPEPYSTLLASNGARHEVMPGVFLGLAVDSELDGIPDPNATGEADDDGVRFTTAMHVGQGAGLEVVASTNGYLNAWIDFNRNGTWVEAGEQILTNQALVAGTNILSFDVPSWTAPTNSFARFRFNTTGSLSYDGAASDGEVEDYAINIEPVADLSVTVSAEPVTVAQGSNLVYTVTVSNAGPSVASEVILTSELSPAATPISMGNCGNTLSCTLGDLAPQGIATATITVNATALGVITNLVTVSAHEADFVVGNNTQTIFTVVQQPATITLPPASLTVTQGQTASFTVLAEGAAPLFYQWFFNDTALLGETNSILQITNAQPVQEGNYTVRVFNEVGATVSGPVSLTVLVPPSIVQQPQCSTNNAGSIASLSVVATGTEPLAFQWYYNATNALADATNSTLVLSNVQASQSGEYHVVVSNAAGTAVSESAHLAVFEWDFGSAPEPPYFTSQTNNGARHLIQPGIFLGARVDFEADGEIPGTERDNDGVNFLSPLLTGQSTKFSVVASTNGWLNAWVDFDHNGSWADSGEQICLNQWLEAGTNQLSFVVPVSGQWTNTFARFRFSTGRDLIPVGDAADGEVEDYQVTIGPAVDLDLQLRDQPTVAALGSNIVVTLLVTNFGPLSASSVTLTDLLPAAAEYVLAEPSQGSCTNNDGVLTCALGTIPADASVTIRVTLKATATGLFTNIVSVTSAETDIHPENNYVLAQTLIQEVPTISRQPQSLIVTNGDAAVFSVAANGTDLTYQWFFNGNALAGANGPQLLITNSSPAVVGIYAVQVTNLVGAVLSEPASLTVKVPAHIITQPQSLTVVAGQSASFQVQAEGTEPLSYQWQVNGVDLPGETQSVLVFTNVQAAHQGEYRVRVSNTVAEELSSPATLTVLELPVITQQPQSRTNYAGSTVALHVTATNVLPLSYQWYSQRSGMIAGETSNSITWTNVQKSVTDDYWVVVSNTAGAVTSQVARLEILEMDFGDAPNSYSTLLAFNGARHEIVPGVYLGSGVDFEPDGQPDSAATGDNANGQNDEDGVTFKTALYVGQTATLEVVASTNGFLDAWIDFNANGTWADWEDQVFASLPLAQGTNTLSIQIPSTAVGSNTFARFRFSTVGGLGFDGPSPDGEVEDYALEILPVSDLAVRVSADPAFVVAGSNYIYNIVVTNIGPSRAEKVMLTNVLPSAASVVSITASAGSCVNNGGVLICDLLSLDKGEQAAVIVELMSPQRTQMLTNTAAVWSGVFDVDQANNLAQLSTAVIGFSEPFANGDMILLPDYGPAAVYPSTLAVSGVTAAVYNVSITLSNLTHTYPPDLSMILVGPAGQSVLLMSDVGSASRIDGVTITLADDAAQYLPERITSGSYKPTYRRTPPSALQPPAPPGPYATNLAVFRGTDPNGVWSLYIVDNSEQDGGYLANGWSLDFETLGPISDLGLAQVAEPATAIKGSNLTYTIFVTNAGPAGASRVVLTDRLPANIAFVSVSANQGNCINADGVVTCTWDSLAASTVAEVKLVVTPTELCFLTNHISVESGETDLNLVNNAAELVTQVKFMATLNPLNDIAIDEDSEAQVIQLTGISSGDPNPSQSIIVTASSSDPSLLPNPVVDYASAQSTGTLTFAPLPNASGVATITVTVSDSSETNLPISRSFQVTVRPVNDPPAISPIANQTILEDAAPFRIPFSIGDVEDSPDRLIVSASAQGILPIESIEISGSGSNRWIQVTPPTNVFGTAVITLAVEDTQGGRASTSCELNIVPVNDWPTLDPIADVTVLKNSGQHTIPLTGISSGASNELQTLAVTASASPEGVLRNVQVVYTSPEPSGALSFEAVPDAAGDVMVSVAVNDGCSSNNLMTRTFRVRVNTPPVIAPADLTIQEDSGMRETVYTVADAESAPNLLDVTVTSSNQDLISDDNILVIRAGTIGFIVVVPSLNAFGTTWLSASVSDPDGGISTNTFQVTVTPVNDPPTLNPLGDLTINEDSGMQRVALSGITSGATNEQQTMAVSVVVSPAGILTNVQTSYISPEITGALSFETVSNANGTVNVTVQVDDGASSNNVVTRSFVVNVLPVNDPPTISPIADQTIDEDSILGPIAFYISDLETTNLTVTTSSSNPSLVPPANIGFTRSGGERTLQLLPATNQFGAAIITVQVRDEGGLETSTSFNLTVTPVNDPPYISAIPDQVTDEDVPKRIHFEVGDAESPAESLIVVAVSSNPDLVPPENLMFSETGTNRVLTLLPAANQYGRATITITANDPDGATTSRTFDFIVNSLNDAPSLDPISDLTIDEDSGPHVVNLSGLFSGSTNEIQNLVVTAVSSEPSLIPDPVVNINAINGKLTFAPATNASGSAIIYVQVNDGQSVNNLYTQSFKVTVRPVNDLPTISAVRDITTDEDTPTAVVPVSIGDVETPASQLILTTASSNLALVPATNIVLGGTGGLRTIRIIPASHENGTARITLTVTDSDGGNTTNVFNLTVNPVNNLPTLDAISDVVVLQNSGEHTVPLAGISSGAANESQVLTITASSSSPQLIPAPTVSYVSPDSTGTLKFTPVRNASGSAIITVTVADGQGTNGSISRNFTVTVKSDNQPPTIDPIPDITIPENSPEQRIVLTGLSSGATNELQSLTLAVSTSNPELIAMPTIAYTNGTDAVLSFGLVTNTTGTAILTVTVNDGAAENNLAIQAFKVTVTPATEQPAIAAVPELFVDEDTPAGPVAFTLENVQALSGSSSNPALVADTNIIFGGAGNVRTLLVVPSADQFGTALITITATGSDGNSTSNNFLLTVAAVNDPPTLDPLTNRILRADAGPQIVNLTGISSGSANETQTLSISAVSSNPALVPNPTIDYTSPSATGTLTLKPALNTNGTAIITVTISDDGSSNNITSRSFEVTILRANTAPVLGSLSNIVGIEDSAVGPIHFTVYDQESPADVLTITASSSNTNLVADSDIFVSGAGTNLAITITPKANQSGTASITLTARDPDGAAASTTFELTIHPVNDAPSLSSIPDQTIDEDNSTAAISFTVDDVDNPVSSLTLTAQSSNPSLIPVSNIVFGGSGTNRTVKITPTTNQFGAATITVTVSDRLSDASTSFSITVNPVNDLPFIATIPNQTSAQDTSLAVPFTVGDIDTPLDSLTLTAASSNPALVPAGNIFIGGNGSNRAMLVTPLPGQNGEGIITVAVSDGVATNSASFVLTITPAAQTNTVVPPALNEGQGTTNSPPTISSISAQRVNEDTLLAIPFTVGDVETPASMLNLTVSSTNTALVAATNIIFSGTGSNRTAYILPATNAFGTSLITFSVSDGSANSSTSFLLTVNPVNDPPTINPVPPVFLLYRPGDAVIALTGITSGASNENQTLSLSVSNSNSSFYSTAPYVTYTSPNSTATLTFRPANNGGTGTNLITIRVSDGGSSNNVTILPILVSVAVSGNYAPIIVTNISDKTILENTSTGPLPFNIRDTVTSSSLLRVSGISSNPQLLPQSGIVFGGSGSNRTVTLTPALHQTGSATVTISVSDANYGGTNFSFVLNVTPVNEPPFISSFSPVTVNEDTPAGPIAFTVSDSETPAASLSVTATSSNPTLVPNANILFGGSGTNRALMIIPATNQTGTATITVSVSDGTGSRSNSFILTVNAVNDPPSISAIADQITNEDTPLTVNFTVGDSESPASALTLASTSSNPALVTNVVFGGSGSNRTAIITPLTNQFGRATITIKVTDINSASTSTSFLLTVNPVNDPPTMSTIPAQSAEEDATIGPIAITVGDLETPAQVLVLTGTSSNPTLLSNNNIIFGGSGSNRTVLLSPTSNQSGTATITLVLRDANGGTATNIFAVTINGINDPPFISAITNQIASESTPTAAIAFTIGDLETPAASLILTGSCSNPALIPNTNIVFGGSGSNRTVTLIPAPNQTGTAQVTIAVTDANNASASCTFDVRVVATNHPPSITNIPDLSAVPGVATRPIGFTIADAVTPPELLTLSAVSGNTELVPNSNIIFGGSGSNRTIAVRPLAQSGNVTITVTVRDTNYAWASDSFVLNITSANISSPLIFDIPDQVLAMDSSTGPVGFAIANADKAADLSFSVVSSNPNLIPASNVLFGGSGSNRTVTVTPAPNQFGTANITVTASNTNGDTGSDIFEVRVNPINHPPSISHVSNQTVSEDSVLGPLHFEIGDAETPAQLLIVSASSSDPSLLPDANIALGGTASNRTVALTPAAHQSGTATVTLLVTDGSGATASTSFLLTVNPINYPPTISTIAPMVIDEDTSTGTIPFSIYDLETASSNLVVTAVSTNQSLVDATNIVLGGNDNLRTLVINPAPNQFGTTLITVSVSDGAASARTSFLLTVNAVNDPPFISTIPDVSTDEDTTTPIIDFAIGDLETSAEQLVVTGYSSNPTLVPAENILLGGTGSNRTVAMIPAANQFGTALITIAVADGSTITSNYFVLTVNPINDLPSISDIPDQVTDENVSTPEVAVTVGDIETPVGRLLLGASSSNPTLLPYNHIFVGGNGSNRTIRLVPAPNQFGTATVTLMVIDEQGGVGARTFAFTVNPVNQPPTISPIPNQAIWTDGHSASIPIVVRDTETPAGELVLNGVSSNPDLIPNDQIQFSGSGMNRILKLARAANQLGTARITITVTDSGGASASSSFDAIVISTNGLPVITFQPQGQSALAGATVTLSVSAASVEPLAYQWQYQGIDLPAQTNMTLFMTNIQPNQAGNYTVAVRNSVGEVTSTPALVSVQGSPNIAILFRADGTPAIRFNSVSGLRYAVEYKDALNSPNWTELDVQTGTGTAMEIEDVGASGSTRFYRVRVE